ncbi:hypothetical protein FGO68_gene6008 [Halteria grandinella]|uniref:Uncharacterized protein n=1 Tax=Halteria grandinella TaxID=5974 RepID=A0A8J8NP90_HALGN|nr:hypothetical protein FGO68_gene6008 [Halteria grandinella]
MKSSRASITKPLVVSKPSQQVQQSAKVQQALGNILRPFEGLPESYAQPPDFVPTLSNSPFAKDGTDLEDLFDSPPVITKAQPYQSINAPAFKEDADMDFDCLRMRHSDVYGEAAVDVMNMPLTSSETKSISKNDITELENRIKFQERQIDTIRDKHTQVVQQSSNKVDKYFCTVQKENVVRRIKFLDSDFLEGNSSCYKDNNPFLKNTLFDGGSIHHYQTMMQNPSQNKRSSIVGNSSLKKTVYQEDQHFTFQQEETLVDQLEKAMIGMFEMMSMRVTPVIENEETKIQMDHYKSHTMGLVQQLKQRETIALRNKITSSARQSIQEQRGNVLANAIQQAKIAPSQQQAFQTPNKTVFQRQAPVKATHHRQSTHLVCPSHHKLTQLPLTNIKEKQTRLDSVTARVQHSKTAHKDDHKLSTGKKRSIKEVYKSTERVTDISPTRVMAESPFQKKRVTEGEHMQLRGRGMLDEMMLA